MLQAQLNPHFLYNTLDCMKWLGVANHVPQIADMSTDLAALLRAGINRKRLVRLDSHGIYKTYHVAPAGIDRPSVKVKTKRHTVRSYPLHHSCGGVKSRRIAGCERKHYRSRKQSAKRNFAHI